jgi:hypothetical protein
VLAAQQALRLVEVSLHDLSVLHTTMAVDSCAEDARSVTEVLSLADGRAEEVSRIIRCATCRLGGQALRLRATHCVAAAL